MRSRESVARRRGETARPPQAKLGVSSCRCSTLSKGVRCSPSSSLNAHAAGHHSNRGVSPSVARMSQLHRRLSSRASAKIAWRMSCCGYASAETVMSSAHSYGSPPRGTEGAICRRDGLSGIRRRPSSRGSRRRGRAPPSRRPSVASREAVQRLGGKLFTERARARTPRWRGRRERGRPRGAARSTPRLPGERRSALARARRVPAPGRQGSLRCAWTSPPPRERSSSSFMMRAILSSSVGSTCTGAEAQPTVSEVKKNAPNRRVRSDMQRIISRAASPCPSVAL